MIRLGFVFCALNFLAYCVVGGDLKVSQLVTHCGEAAGYLLHAVRWAPPFDL
jgi:hypothetical protein